MLAVAQDAGLADATFAPRLLARAFVEEGLAKDEAFGTNVVNDFFVFLAGLDFNFLEFDLFQGYRVFIYMTEGANFVREKEYTEIQGRAEHFIVVVLRWRGGTNPTISRSHKSNHQTPNRLFVARRRQFGGASIRSMTIMSWSSGPKGPGSGPPGTAGRIPPHGWVHCPITFPSPSTAAVHDLA
mmetsp:Transcript_39450/g.80946  ORF Transcript_39450/g.80946 Transcript_39450/m.80946 type:complete len:184 (-) Transcript_39450:543-1094(-)